MKELTYRLRCQDCGFEHSFFRGWSFAGKGCSGVREGPNALLHHWRPVSPGEEARARALARMETLPDDLTAFASQRVQEREERYQQTEEQLRAVLLELMKTEANLRPIFMARMASHE